MLSFRHIKISVFTKTTYLYRRPVKQIKKDYLSPKKIFKFVRAVQTNFVEGTKLLVKSIEKYK